MSEKPNELRLAPWEYVFTQDVAKGSLQTSVGPCVVNQTGQEVPMVYKHKVGFSEVPLSHAKRSACIAPEGFYISLLNPSDDDKAPLSGKRDQELPKLREGHRVNIPGPHSMALWPGQHAKVVRGHQLRSNWYLLAKVYNEEEARKNWDKGIVKVAEAEEEENEGAAKVKGVPMPDGLAVGKLVVIKGTDVSFYIPPTGVTVVAHDGNEDTADYYARSALTLERLDYCILRDESGSKRFVIGPDVVFPEPTETFITDKKKNRAFRAVELNDLQGIHIKVIAEYKDEDGTVHKVGEEMFLTGETTPIYIPREEHSVIRYDGRTKHFAVAIPKGEAKYVLNRMTGDVRKLEGPTMALLDPRTEVFVRRVLSPKECMDMYPGNEQVMAYNAHLADVAAGSPTTRSGVVSEGDLLRSRKKMAKGGGMQYTEFLGKSSSLSDGLESTRLGEQHAEGASFERAGTFTVPRTVTLDNKFQGVPKIDVWPGFAIQVKSTDDRRVVIGPTTVLLAYDETLERMELSTGKPKTTDDLLPVSYLRAEENKVSDRMWVETADHVRVELKLSLVVNFLEDLKEKWWSVDNYVKLLTDHVRSVVKARVKKMSIRDFYAQPIDLIRDFVLGVAEEDAERPGMSFKNGMRVDDVEVLKVFIQDEGIREMLNRAQHEAVASSIAIANAARQLEDTRTMEGIKRDTTEEQAHTHATKIKFQIENLLSTMKFEAESQQRSLIVAQAEYVQAEAQQEHENMAHNARLKRKEATFVMEDSQAKIKFDRHLEDLRVQTAALVERFNAIDPALAAEIGRLTDEKVMETVAKHLGETAMSRAQGLEATLKEVFDMFPEGMQMIKHVGNGSNGTAKKLAAPVIDTPTQ
jgi:major vault protein